MAQDAIDHDADPFDISLANRQAVHVVDEDQLISAARRVLEDSPFASAEISLVVVDDEAIHELNRRYLDHDYPTDVLSFVLDVRDGHVDGEVIISADTAAIQAAEIGWPAAAEQLLYVIHGMLHVVGFRDKTPDEATAMRVAEKHYLSHFGYEPPPLPDS